MAIRYIVHADKSGRLFIYQGDFASDSTVLYTIENDRVNGGYLLRAYPSPDIAYTLVEDKTRPGNYLVYPGSDIMYGARIDYYVQRDTPYTIVRKGDSIYGEEVFIVREGSGYGDPKYIVEERETFSKGYAPGDNWGAFDPVVNSTIGKKTMEAFADPGGTIKENLKHPLKRFFGGYVDLAKDLGLIKDKPAPAEPNQSQSQNIPEPPKPTVPQETIPKQTAPQAPAPKPTVQKDTTQKGKVPMKYYLPVGSVVLLKGATKRIMVIGYQTSDVKNPGKVYDYSGVLYPEGSLSSDQTLLFDHEQIDQIHFVGFQDQDYYTFMENLYKVITNQPLQ